LICTLCTSLAGMAEIVKENTKMWGRHCVELQYILDSRVKKDET
jgi:hypothetical protein